jgi:hypothetical protein
MSSNPLEPWNFRTFQPLKSPILSMADGYLESHYAEYEQRKAAWLKKKKKIQPRPLTPKPEDEAL